MTRYGVAGQGFGMSPLLKSLISVVIAGPTSGYGTARSFPNSVVELPPKWLIVPGMKLPPCWNVHVPACTPVVKNG